jgi:hypothetical protein
MGTAWSVYTPFRFCWTFLGYAFFRIDAYVQSFVDIQVIYRVLTQQLTTG